MTLPTWSTAIVSCVRGKTEFFVGLIQQFLGPLRVTAKSVIVIPLRNINEPPCLHDVLLRVAEIPMTVANVHPRCFLGHRGATDRKKGAHEDASDENSGFHTNS